MVQKFKEGMISDKVAERILWLSILFFIIFFGITILSYRRKTDSHYVVGNTVKQ